MVRPNRFMSVGTVTPCLAPELNPRAKALAWLNFSLLISQVLVLAFLVLVLKSALPQG